MAPEWLAAVVRTALDAEIANSWQPATGALADTYVIELTADAECECDRVVCKRGGASIWTGDVIEPLVVELVAEETDLPVPTVLARGSLAHADGPDRWALYEFRAGTLPSTETAAQRSWLAARAGSLLGRLHASKQFDRRGGLAREGERLVLRPSAGVTVLNSRLAKRLVTVSPATDPAVPPVLAHGDFQPANVLVEGTQVTAVLDWGNAHVTHPGFSLARAEFRFADRPAATGAERAALRERFRRAYEVHHPLPAAVETELTLFKALWVFQAARNLVGVARTPRGRTQLRRQLRRWQ